MTDQTEDPGAPHGEAADKTVALKRPGERLAKTIARAGLGSRRDAEIWIGEGRVKVNGEVVSAAATNVTPGDRVEVDDRPLPARERTRLWLYHKPRGYVTTNHDPEGRDTVFSVLPDGLPRVMTVGRLDINTEGLLLLTNDGGLARVLELPETGWLRRYRVRAFGRVTKEALDALKDGVTIDGFAYGAIEAEIERQQNDNVWLNLGLREGKNREVKRVAEHLGLAVNRLIRVSFGPFQLGGLPEGEAEEVRTKTLSEQLGPRLAEEGGCDFEAPVAMREEAPRKTGGRGAGKPKPAERSPRSRLADPSQRVGARAPIARPRDMAAPASAGPQEERPTRTKRGAPIADRRGRKVAVARVSRLETDPAPKRVHRRDESAAERFGATGRTERSKGPPRDGGRSSHPAGLGGPAGGKRFDRGPGGRPRRDPSEGDRPFRRPADGPARGDRPGRPPRAGGDRPRAPGPEGFRDRGDRPARASGSDGDRPRQPRVEGFRADRGERSASAPRWREGGAGDERAPRADRPRAPAGERPAGRRPARGDRPQGSARPPRSEGDGPRFERPSGPRSERGDRPTAAPRWRDASPGDGSARPREQRPSRGDRPEGARPPRREWTDKPPRSRGEGRPDRPARREDPAKPAPFRGGKPDGAARPASKGGFGRPPGGRGGPSGGKPSGGRPGGGGKGRPGGGADRRR